MLLVPWSGHATEGVRQSRSQTGPAGSLGAALAPELAAARTTATARANHFILDLKSERETGGRGEKLSPKIRPGKRGVDIIYPLTAMASPLFADEATRPGLPLAPRGNVICGLPAHKRRLTPSGAHANGSAPLCLGLGVSGAWTVAPTPVPGPRPVVTAQSGSVQLSACAARAC